MDVIVKARHTAVQDRFREHVTGKLAKIQKLDRRVIRIDVEISKERNPRLADRRERVELTIRSRGPVIRAEASADDRYAAFDLALGKLENRLRKLGDRRKVHHGGRSPLSTHTVAATLAQQGRATGDTDSGTPEPVASGVSGTSESFGPSGTPAAPSDADAAPLLDIDMEGDGPLVVREKYHRAAPMTVEQALFEMELVGHDFFLFRDRDRGYPSVVYRRRGYDYGVLRLVEE